MVGGIRCKALAELLGLLSDNQSCCSKYDCITHALFNMLLWKQNEGISLKDQSVDLLTSYNLEVDATVTL